MLALLFSLILNILSGECNVGLQGLCSSSRLPYPRMQWHLPNCTLSHWRSPAEGPMLDLLFSLILKTLSGKCNVGFQGYAHLLDYPILGRKRILPSAPHLIGGVLQHAQHLLLVQRDFSLNICVEQRAFTQSVSCA